MIQTEEQKQEQRILEATINAYVAPLKAEIATLKKQVAILNARTAGLIKNKSTIRGIGNRPKKV